MMVHKQSKTIARKGEGIYHARLKKLLEPKYHGWCVAIEVESGNYFLGQTTTEALSPHIQIPMPKKGGSLNTVFRITLFNNPTV